MTSGRKRSKPMGKFRTLNIITCIIMIVFSTLATILTTYNNHTLKKYNKKIQQPQWLRKCTAAMA